MRFLVNISGSIRATESLRVDSAKDKNEFFIWKNISILGFYVSMADTELVQILKL